MKHELTETNKWIKFWVAVVISVILVGLAYMAYVSATKRESKDAEALPKIEISVEINLGEIIGGLLVGFASILGAVAYAFKEPVEIGSTKPIPPTRGGDGGPDAPKGEPGAGTEKPNVNEHPEHEMQATAVDNAQHEEVTEAERVQRAQALLRELAKKGSIKLKSRGNDPGTKVSD